MTATTAGPVGVLVPLQDVRRRLGYPKGDDAALLREQATEHGIDLDVRTDWAGRACVPEAQARALVQAVQDARARAAVAQRARVRADELAAQQLQRRYEQRAALCYRLALERFGDEGVAIALAHEGASQAVPDEAITQRFEAAGVRWQQGFRTLAPAPGRVDQAGDVPANLDDVQGRDWLRQHGLDALDKPIPLPAARRLREVMRPGGPW
jgi:hypothetical protein